MRRYLVYFANTVAAVLLLTAFLGCIFEPFLPLVGDLTRVGNYAEKDFGWHAKQPVIHVMANDNTMTAPDVLVLGDSFSKDNLWQSVVTARTGQKVQTFEIARVGCMRNWLSYAVHHPTAKTIIIESVERSFLANFKTLPECEASTPRPVKVSASTTAAQRSTWPPEWHILRTFKLSYYTLAMQRHPDGAIRNGQVTNAPIDRQCANFSNRRADRLLYFSQDEEKFRWSRADIDRAISNVLQIQKAVEQSGKKFVLLLAPDKQTVYQRCLLNAGEFAYGQGPGITASMIAAGIHTPDLHGIFQQNIGKIEDLYRPNDTHLSEAGYILMGEQVVRLLAGKML